MELQCGVVTAAGGSECREDTARVAGSRPSPLEAAAERGVHETPIRPHPPGVPVAGPASASVSLLPPSRLITRPTSPTSSSSHGYTLQHKQHGDYEHSTR